MDHFTDTARHVRYAATQQIRLYLGGLRDESRSCVSQEFQPCTRAGLSSNSLTHCMLHFYVTGDSFRFRYFLHALSGSAKLLVVDLRAPILPSFSQTELSINRYQSHLAIRRPIDLASIVYSPSFGIGWGVSGRDRALLGLLSHNGMSWTLSGRRTRQLRSRSHIRVRWGRLRVKISGRVCLTWNGLSSESTRVSVNRANQQDTYTAGCLRIHPDRVREW